MELFYHCSYRRQGESIATMRHVFRTSMDDVFVVLTRVTDDIKTVRLWTGASLAATASFWGASEQFLSSTLDVEHLAEEAMQILNRLR